MKITVTPAVLALCALPIAGPAFAQIAVAGTQVDVVGRHLQDPRGITFSPTGQPIVGEAGAGNGFFYPNPIKQGPLGRTQCFIQWPLGNVRGTTTARVSAIDSTGHAVPIAENLPAGSYNNAVGGDREGISAVAYLGNTLYALNPGGGCSHGHSRAPDALLRIQPDGTTQLVADLGRFLSSQTDSKNPTDVDFEPDGVWYSMAVVGPYIYTVEPNSGVLIKVGAGGKIIKVADLWAKVAAIDANGDGDKTFTALTRHGDSLYAGTFGRYDQTALAGYIYKVSFDGQTVTQVASGLHAIAELAFDTAHRMYALQSATLGDNGPNPDTGSLVRVEADGSLTTLVSGLNMPSGLAASPNGAFYITNCGYHCDSTANFPPKLTSLREGQLLEVTVPGAFAAP